MATPNTVQVQWIWEGASQLAVDSFVNTYHFTWNGVAPDDYENIRDMLRDFYTELAPDQENVLTDYMSTETCSGNWTIKIYNLEDPKPRYPVYTYTDSHVMSGASGLPTECATVMSFQAVRVAGEKQARRRNRVYLGPWSNSALSSAMVAPSLVQDILFAAKGLINAANTSQKWAWAVYSPTTNDTYDVDSGWVDNGWDTQRRRGLASTARGPFDLDEPVA